MDEEETDRILAKASEDEIKKALENLIEKGYVDVGYRKGELVYRLNKKGVEAAKTKFNIREV